MIPRIKQFLKVFLPPTCPLCRAVIEEDHTLCPKCFSAFPFISDPLCDKCGGPLSLGLADGEVCGGCLKKGQGSSISKARSVAKYAPQTSQLIKSFKEGDCVELSSFMGKLMYSYGENILKDVELITSVPLFWRKMVKRKFNQAAMLANEVGKYSNLPVCNNVLLRREGGKAQKLLGRSERKKQAKELYAVDTNLAPFVEGRVLLLIDDVYTTGATLEACAKALKDKGAQEVRTLTFAKTSH